MPNIPSSWDWESSMETGMRTPILVTGAHRSGTTWVGKMLCAGGEAHYIHEPFNAGRYEYSSGPGCIKRRFPYWFYCISDENSLEYRSLLEDLTQLHYPLFDAINRIRKPRHVGRIMRDWSLTTKARVQRKRPLIKDPIALFSAEWLAERFDMNVIVMIRHPLGFASSLKRLNWQFDFTDWLNQDSLMQRYLSPFREQILEYSRSKKEIIDQAILMWNAMYSVVYQYQQAHPEWLFVKHEHLATAPLDGFQRLYEHCGLTWNDKAKSKVIAWSGASNPEEVTPNDSSTIKRDSQATIKAWKRRLSHEEIGRLKVATAEVADLFYEDTDWD